MKKQHRAWLFSFLLAGCATTTEAPVDTNVANVVSGNGITVTGQRWITARTLEVDISTALIDPIAVNGPHRIRITLPEDYATTVKRYPVMYLLHGGAGGNSAQWTDGGGATEDITTGHPVITVMPDGGKVGWFTNWVDQSHGAQQWADFYIQQVIPWVDANFRTVAAQNGRAIGGLSMGGYGAVRLAQDRPDLFASVGSFSGAVDLGDLGTRAVVTEQALQNGFPPGGPFGNPFWPRDTVWNAEDPMHRPTALAGHQVLLYAGGGTSDVDVLERTMGQSAYRFSNVLDANGIDHTFWMYGVPGPLSPFGCDGGHDFTCWNFAFNDYLPRMLSVVETPAVAPGTNIAANGDMEHGLASWGCYGPCGTDWDGTYSRNGAANSWVRNDNGWNDLHQTIPVQANKSYTVTGWVRTSDNLVDGFFGLRTGDGTVLSEQHFSAAGTYTKVTATATSGSNASLEIYGGFWADGDTFLQLDDVSVIVN
jgi:S-formylglutathione hydrolase FrmB